MRSGATSVISSSISLAEIEDLPAPTPLILTRVTAQELALKIKTGQCGPLKPCCYSPASNTLKVLSVVWVSPEWYCLYLVVSLIFYGPRPKYLNTLNGHLKFNTRNLKFLFFSSSQHVNNSNGSEYAFLITNFMLKLFIDSFISKFRQLNNDQERGIYGRI